jgi:hypothetical protein
MTDFWLQILAFVRVGLCLSVVIFEFEIAGGGEAHERSSGMKPH